MSLGQGAVTSNEHPQFRVILLPTRSIFRGGDGGVGGCGYKGWCKAAHNLTFRLLFDSEIVSPAKAVAERRFDNTLFLNYPS
ncbi:MAG: hypothetical protein HYZ34_12100 [Ignavibacteriae bacterium]|nr:hypothetical protein [Ignavibacteriota bacterium]